MCQKASGGPFMAFVRFPIDAVAWTAAPDIFESSNMVERGFCNKCGTPLTYRWAGGPFISVTLNSLDDPQAVEPSSSLAADQKARWLQDLDSLPGQAAEAATKLGFISHQVP